MPLVRTISLQFSTTDGIKLPPVSFTVQDGKDAYETWLELPGNEGKSKQDYLDYLRYTIPVVQTTGNLTGSVMSQDITTKELNKRVPITRTINGKPLNSNIVLSPADIGTYPTATIDSLLDEKVNLTDSRLTNSREWIAATMPQAEAEAGTATTRRAVTSLVLRQATVAYTYSKTHLDTEFGKKVDKTITVNGKPLSANVVLGYQDVKAVSETDPRLTDSREWSASTVSQAVAEAGTSTARQAFTSLRVRQNVAVYAYSKTHVDNTFVPKSITINGKPLNNNINITLEELGGVNPEGGVASAQKLAVARKINGIEFDGTKDIVTPNWGTSRTFTLGSSSKAVNGSGNVSFSLTEMGAVSNTDARLSNSREWSASTMTQAEAEGGTSTTRRAVTSLVLRQAVSAYALSKAESNTQAALKVDKTAVVQTTGTSTTNIMSQKATTDALATKAPSSHTHPWNQVTDKPSSATRWPTYAEVTGKPSTYAPSAHTHTAAQVTGLGTSATRNVGTTAGTVAAGDDSRIVNAVPNSRTITAGTGLTGGGNLTANRTVSISTGTVPSTAKQLSTENLDTVQAPGYYYQPTNANATTARNYPVGSAGTLVVTTAAGVVQEYTAYGPTNRKFIRGYYNGWSAWKEVGGAVSWDDITGNVPAARLSGTYNIAISGNAASATKLATARTINGTSFNGTANITTANWGTSRNLTVGATAKAVNGSANVSWSLDEIGTYSKAVIDSKINALPKLLSGTTQPTTATGKAGDWYIVY